jgi:DNA polymerase sigma
MNHINGCQTGLLIRKILEKNFFLKPIIIILKVLLKMNDLNEASSGGMSSFLLFHLVFFYYNKYKKEIIEKNLFNQMINFNEEEKEYKLLCEDISNNSNGNDINMELSSFDSNSNIKSINSYDNSTYSSKTVLSTFEEDNSNNSENNLTKNNSNGAQSKTTSKSSNENDNLYLGNNNDSNIDYISESMYSTKSSNKHEKINDEITNLCEFLLSFLKFYGYEFDYENLGFSINKNNFCTTFFKIERTDMECGNGLCVESLQDKGVNVGKICYNYRKIVNLFKETYEKIKIEIKNNTCSILKSLGFPLV